MSDAPEDPTLPADNDAAPSFRAAAPRPLAAHLSAGAIDLQQAAALAAALDDPRFPWRPSLRPLAEKLAQEPGAADRAALARAVAREGVEELGRVVDGMVHYRRTPPLRRPPAPTEIWRRGNSRLFAYPAPKKRRGAVFVVPSLVNGSAILDLTTSRSLLRGLTAKGLQCYLLDWGDPDAEEREFDVTAYATLRALPALDAAIAAQDGPVSVLGHCMAGAIAALAARFRLDRVNRLALMASPWDFEPMRPEGIAAPRREELIRILELFGALFGGVPADLLNSIFFLRDPLQAIRKFSRFTPARRNQTEGRLFVAVEDWLNDGMRLAAPAARTLFVDWGIDNALLNRRWPSPEDPLDLDALGIPVLVVASKRDTLTPFASACAALNGAPGAELLEPRAGHVGMVVGSSAKSELWTPLADWLTR